MKFSPAALSLLALPLTTAFPLSFLFSRDLTATTQNDIVNNAPCKALTIIFARGTNSPGNVGESTGPPFFQAVAAAIGADKLAVQGVTYSANIFGFLGGGDSAGSTTMANLVARTATQCPTTQIVMSGYSQGAQLVHNSARMLSAANVARISSVVMFGDPNNGSTVGLIPGSKVKTFCHTGDNICEGGILVLPAHSNYGADAPAAAAFVKSKSGL